MENKHTAAELRQMQALPLDLKIRMTENRIKAWVNEYGVEGVYVSFSGGKDSTVLLDIVRRLYPNVEAVFMDTGLEYPEIREFVRGYENVTWLRPKMTFKQVIDKYGYPFIGKETASRVYGARSYLRKIAKMEQERILANEDTIVEGAWGMADMINIRRRRNEGYSDDYILLKQGILIKRLADEQHIDLREISEKGSYMRTKQLFGEWLNRDGEASQYNQEKYLFFLDAPFEISEACCGVMKKAPAKLFEKQSGKHPITAQMANESRQRFTKWIQHGCNAFETSRPLSNPMAFWTEQDVLLYIKTRHLKICSVYGEIVTENGEAVTDGTIDFIKACNTPLKTTGCERTGCMFCGFGCHLDKKGEGRFLRMKETHPKQYAYIMKPKEEGGLGYKEVIDWINEHGNMHIEY